MESDTGAQAYGKVRRTLYLPYGDYDTYGCLTLYSGRLVDSLKIA